MSIGAGIAAQIGMAQETTPGTAVTPTRFYEFDGETLTGKKKTVQGGGLRPDKTYDRASRRRVVARDAGGDLNLAFPTKAAGLLLANMLGSYATTAVQQGATTAYRQIHVPGAFSGKALTLQKGVPGSNGTVVPFTYPGSVITGWELSCAMSDLLKLKCTFDSWDELTPNSTPAGPGLASASYAATQGDFTFVEGALLSGGTATTASGLTAVSGATAVAAVTAATITGANPRKVDRFFAGSLTKAEQIQNALNTIAGQITAEFYSSALYDLYRADTQSVIQLTFTSALLAGTAIPYSLSIIIPAAFFEDGASPQVSGPDVVSITAPFTGLDDGTNPVIQIVYITTDTTV